MSICIVVLLPIFAVFLLVFFFLSIYVGSTYLQEHVEVSRFASVEAKNYCKMPF